MTPDTERVLASLAALRALSDAPMMPGGRCRVAVTPATLDAALDVAEAAARLREAQRDWATSALGGYAQLSDTGKIVEAEDALDAALARLAEVLA